MPAAQAVQGVQVAEPAAVEKLLPATQLVQTWFAVAVHVDEM